MPIEREFKFILDPSKISLSDLSKKVENGELNYSSMNIRQGYLTPQNRIRETEYKFVGGNNEPKDKVDLIEYCYTFKTKDGEDSIEIETDIDVNDFNRLWPKTKDRLIKTRISSDNPGPVKWEIDFFLDADNEIYFVMAECEVYDGGMSRYMPDFVNDALLLEVGKTTNHISSFSSFSSYAISDIEYAKIMLESLKNMEG